MLHPHNVIVCSKMNNKGDFYQLIWSDIPDRLFEKAKRRSVYIYNMPFMWRKGDRKIHVCLFIHEKKKERKKRNLGRTDQN